MLSRRRAVMSALVAVLTVGFLGVFVLGGGRQDGTAVQSSTLTAQITSIPQAAGPCPSPSGTVSPSPSATSTGSAAPATLADANSPADSASATASVTPTGTPTPCPSPSTSTSATPTGSASPTGTGTGTPTQTTTPTPTTSPTATTTPTPTPTPTPTQASATLTLTAPKSVAILKSVTLTGNLTISGGTAVPGGTTLTVARAGPDGTTTLPPVTVPTTGAYSLTDKPPAYGTYTYTASYAGTAAISSATAKYSVTVTRLATTLSLASSASAVSYQAKVTITAHLGVTYTGRQVSIYAQSAGSTSKQLLKTGTVSSAGDLSVTYSPSYSTTFSVTFPGDARYAPRTATRAVVVSARVTQAISGYYASETYNGTLYRVYHHTATLADTVTVTPNKHGECALFDVQVYFQGTWSDDVTTGCGTLSSSSHVYGRFSLATAAGARYRIRAVYHPSSGDVTNGSGASAWLYFRVAS